MDYVGIINKEADTENINYLFTVNIDNRKAITRNPKVQSINHQKSNSDMNLSTLRLLNSDSERFTGTSRNVSSIKKTRTQS